MEEVEMQPTPHVKQLSTKKCLKPSGNAAHNPGKTADNKKYVLSFQFLKWG
jgi:hypothetical protein